MKLTTILIGGAVLVGLGFYLSRKFSAKYEDDEAVLYARESETYGDKLHKASMFAVGAIKTGADKIAEGIKDIRNQDMVKLGEETFDQAKETASDIIGDLKDMAVSINITGGADIEPDAEENDEDDGFFSAEPPEEEKFDNM